MKVFKFVFVTGLVVVIGLLAAEQIRQHKEEKSFPDARARFL